MLKMDFNLNYTILLKYRIIICVILLIINTCFNDVLIRKISNDPLALKFAPFFFTEFFRILIFIGSIRKFNINLTIIFLSLCYLLQNILIWTFIRNISPLYYTICYKSRIIFTSILSLLILNKRYSLLQNCGQLIIILGIVIPKILEPYDKNDDILAIIALLGASLLSSLASVVFEIKIKRKSIPISEYNIVYGITAFVLSFIFVSLEIIIKKTNPLDTFKREYFIESIISSVICTIIYSYLSFLVSPVRRNFIGIVVSFTSTMIINWWIGDDFSISKLASIFAVYLGVLMFEYSNLIKKEAFC
ncbi:UDP-galactose translocator [Astathelohania contejeani]|uniref:UDP-galactose translocator n=1 Tax=Astathelohania contejeani TaxID=164912 RepID=A0ABQ7I284_9MICR|nr:UDP-galactose translocator [Thelohania contejeani]